MKPNLTIIYGTRPEAIKLASLCEALRSLGARVHTICTGQHTTLLEQVPGPVGDTNESLDMASKGEVAWWRTRAACRLRAAITAASPDAVIVQGDTMSAVAGAEASSYAAVPLIHVEAGVRSHQLDDPDPEERLRLEIAQLADLNIPATATARDNLIHEDIPGKVTPPTGNTGVSTFLNKHYSAPFGISFGPYLVTLHRRELREDPNLEKILTALNGGYLWSWPVHPAIKDQAWAYSDMHLTTAISYAEMNWFLKSGTISAILTDSGGLVEEAATLGIPTAILRNFNDRPEAVQAGYARRFNRTPSGVRCAIDALENDKILKPTLTPFPYGTADSAANCAETIIEFLK